MPTAFERLPSGSPTLPHQCVDVDAATAILRMLTSDRVDSSIGPAEGHGTSNRESGMWF